VLKSRKVMIVSEPRLRAVRIDAFTISTCDIYLRYVPGVGAGRQIEGRISDGDGCRYLGQEINDIDTIYIQCCTRWCCSDLI